MEPFYPAFKHSHLMFVAVSILLFNLRFWLRFARPERALHKVLRIVPHINDTLLLFTGMLMMAVAHFSPFGAHRWLGVKLLLVLCYIAAGFVALKRPPRSRAAGGAYVAGMVLVLAVAALARFKPI